MSGVKAYLEGGPEALSERIVSITPPGVELKIPFRGGYEHFRATARHAETAEGQLPVFEWVDRTRVAE
ncbi:DUF5988 family protein [Nocardia pseudobrasiliensis]|uniref:Uncharacterized protein n=1 Tax=Nocardia pseudobrasiliensis TaxID=45979 RepID=A0A370I3U7_9NOCA|nr:DUF5988 family protein [Nocardia pseudobrasiliensis]RDI65405.1 hypothetical protein DFR76_106275 [Nocardia pseudobrasiliensis]